MATTWYTQRICSYVMRAGADHTLTLTWRGSWDSTPAAALHTLGHALIDYKAGSGVIEDVTIASGASPQPYRLAFRRFVSEPMAAGTGAGTFNMCLGVQENSADAEYYTKVYAYMTEGDTDVVRCVLLDYEGDTGTDTEWPTTGEFYDIDTPPSLNANSWQAGDRLVIEFGGIARNTLGAARTAHVWVGGGATDGVVGQTNVTSRAGRFTFSSNIFIPQTITLVEGDIVIGNGDVAAFDGVTGNLKGVFYIPNTTQGAAAGAYTSDGHVWVTVEGQRQIHKLDMSLSLVATHFTGAVQTLPHFIAFQPDGTYWLGHTGNTSNGPCINDSGLSPSTGGTGALLHMSAAGAVIGAAIDPTKEASGTPSGDLHADGVTMAYGSLGRTIFQVDLNSGAQLSDFATLSGSTPTNTVRGMKWTPDGGLLVADGADVKRLSPAGAVLQQYTDASQSDWGTIALGPTGVDYFWSANTGQNVGGSGLPMMAKFDFDGTVLMRIYMPTSSDLTGAANSQLCSGGIIVIGGFRAGPTGVIGPLAWVHWPRRIPGSPSSTITDTYSDMDMQCPEDWENGFKEGLVTRWGDAERPSSHLFTGEWQGSTFTFQIADQQGRFRAQQASFVDRYWNDALTVRMTTRANRANRGIPYTVFSGPIIDAQPTPSLLWDLTLGDVVSQGLLSDRAQVPWRQIKDGFLSQLTEISENLDREGAEPIIYGTFDREPGDVTSPATNTGVRLVPIYLGIENVPVYGDCHVWLVCGHATFDLNIFVDDVPRFETVVFNHWLIPHQSEFQSAFGAPYRDIASDTYGNLRRYTLVYGQVGTSEPDDCATGVKTLTVAVSGVESAGDGGGSLLHDRYEQYKHFLINFVANSGPQSYQSGAWLTNPVWDIFDGPVEKVNEDSFDDAAAIANARILNGYIGAAAIGLGGDRASVKTWIATWNRSCACRFGITHEGQLFIYLLSPTDAIKAAAVLYTDAYEILEESFSTEFRWDEQATTIPFQTDYDMQSQQYQTNGAVQDLQAITNYGRDIPSEVRRYDFAPGADQAEHLATLELRIRTHAPRYVRLEGTIGHDPVTGDSLAYRDIGDYIRYVSFDAVQETREERLAQVVTPIVRVGSRKVGCVAMDCEDLIGYDLEGSPGGSWGTSP